MKFPKWSTRRARHRDYVPVADDEDDDGSARGGYVISVDAQAPPMTLVKSIPTVREEEISVSGSAHELKPGLNYLLGGPGQPTCEVVEVAAYASMPGDRRHLRRGRFRTVASPHPAGTSVAPVTVQRIEDWLQWAEEGVGG
ncbi:hypothetical protein [Streptomyces sp. NPDC096934]|uniref:hypothetical protein n=1 Tax=Streptomyces sp. NPDC096934 TaxID=3155551 RepID=UPI00332FFE86